MQPRGDSDARRGGGRRREMGWVVVGRSVGVILPGEEGEGW